MYFPKRAPEPIEMGELEHKVFSELSQDNYKRWFIPLVDDAIVSRLSPNAKILDVGSGPGYLSKELSSRSSKYEVVGVDVSDDALKIAKKTCSGINNVSFSKGAVESLPFKTEEFDLVICKDSFHHFDDPKVALKEMLRVLKSGGILYIQDLRRDVPMYLLRRSIPLESVIQKLQYYSVRAAYTKKEIGKYLAEFAVSKVVIRTRKLTRDNIARYKRL